MQLTRSLLFAVMLLCGCTTIRSVEPGAVDAVIAELKQATGCQCAHRGLARRSRGAVGPADAFQAEGNGEVLAFARSDVLAMKIPRAAPGKSVAMVYVGIIGIAALFSGEID